MQSFTRNTDPAERFSSDISQGNYSDSVRLRIETLKARVPSLGKHIFDPQLDYWSTIIIYYTAHLCATILYIEGTLHISD